MTTAMRPSFELHVDDPVETLVDRARAGAAGVADKVSVQMAGEHLELLIHESDRHYWSPWLSVTIDEDDPGSRVRGRFGPHPAVWTMFMSIHIFLAFCGISALMYGLSVLVLGHVPWALLIVPVVAVLMSVTFVGMRVGQRLGQDQMHVLQDALDDLLGCESGHVLGD